MARQAEIQKGRILAKAIIRRKDGKIEAGVVYAGSRPTEFFYTYRLRSVRSPRKSWKSASARPRIYNQYNPVTFESWLATFAWGAEIVSVKVYHVRKLAELIKKPDLEFYGPRKELQAWETQKLRAKEAGKLRGGYQHVGGWPR